jgi:hypothetical protein
MGVEMADYVKHGANGEVERNVFQEFFLPGVSMCCDRHIWRCDPQEEQKSPYKQLQIQWQQSTVMLEVLRSSWTFALRYKREEEEFLNEISGQLTVTLNS